MAEAWSPNEYLWNPYDMEAKHISPPTELPETDSAIKRKGGRQRRSTILCQVISGAIQFRYPIWDCLEQLPTSYSR